MFLESHRKHSRWVYILLAVVSGFLILIGIGVAAWKKLPFGDLLSSSLVQKGTVAVVGEKHRDVVSSLPLILGFTEPKTYLLLFQNNTEMRPSGGFIGVYAVVEVRGGHVSVLKVEGTEVLDREAPATWNVQPPKQITEHLKVDRWYFRDSNWSPDFAESAKQALAFYRAEGGVAADRIDAVIAITPTVLEELMKITGPFTIQDIVFSAENVTETLEYEVEYGYDDRGVARINRKQIIEPFMKELLAHLKETAVSHAGEYLSLTERLVKEKQILAYAANEEFSALVKSEAAGGQVRNTDGDYVWWVDANLAALKTDHAMVRTLSYAIEPRSDGQYVGTVQMKYTHTGNFDWRTTRYRTYARVYVPKGSVLVGSTGAMKRDRSTEAGGIDQGEELGKQWFGAFISIEPGKEGVLSFSYLVPKNIADQITKNTYQLLVQKQAGTIAHRLTLGLNFGKTIQSAYPPEKQEEWGNGAYTMETDLQVDREFIVTF